MYPSKIQKKSGENMNINELKAVLARNGETFGDLATALGLSRPWLSAKVNEKKGAFFTQPEILAIKNRYSLNDEQIGTIFFNTDVS